MSGNRDKIFILSFLAFFLAFLLFVVKPMFLRCEELDGCIKLLEREVVSAKNAEAFLDRFDSSYFDIFFADGLSSDEAGVSMLRDLERLFSSNGIAVMNIKPLPVKSEGGITSIPVAVELEADMKSFVRFLGALKRDFPASYIRSLKIKKSKSSGGGGILSLKLEIVKIYLGGVKGE